MQPIKTSREDIEKRLNRQAKVEIPVDMNALTKKDALIVQKLIDASNLMDEIYLRQINGDNPRIRNVLRQSSDPDDSLRLEYFNRCKSPWDGLQNDEPFIGIEKRRDGCEFYPADMTKEEFELWLDKHHEDKAAFTSYYTIIRRLNGGLVAIPYSTEYSEFLVPAAKLLREAAKLTDNLSLRNFLASRADAFLSNEYLQSELDWLELNSKIQITLGPYETYDDRLLGYKATFTSLVTIDDAEESKKLHQLYAPHLSEIDEILPINPNLKFTRKNETSAISIANLIYAGGEASSLFSTRAFNLPNDEKAISINGSKTVLLKNLIEHKFNKIIKPVAENTIDESQLPHVTLDADFICVLFHEFSHGIGPSEIIMADRTNVPVYVALKEVDAPLEEIKANIGGLYCVQYFIDKGILPPEIEWELYPTYMADLFSSVRTGTNQAHGKAEVVTYNYLKNDGDSIQYNKNNGLHYVDPDSMKHSVCELLKEVLNIQAKGDYEDGKQFVNSYDTVPPEIKDLSRRLSNIPTNIYPAFKVI